MKFKTKFMNQIVGLFALIALVFLAGILIMMGINQRWFARNFSYTSRFTSGKGLYEGMSISFKGFEIGKITDISLTEDNNVAIQFYIQDRYQPKVFANSVLQLVASPLGLGGIGGGGLVLHQGVTETEPLEEFSYIPSLDLPEGRYLVSRGLVKIPKDDDAVARVLEDAESILANVNIVLESFNRTLTAINDPAKGDAAAGEIVKNLIRMTTEINRILIDLNNMTSDSTGLIVKLLDPKGSVATFLNDNNRIYNQVESLLSDAAVSMGEVKNFSSIFSTARPQILELLEEGREAVKLGQDVLEALRNNPLLRGGVTPRLQTPTTQQGYRDEVF
jgi:phospholipid/cholesterol/gamma-HCH transport system substrate-binding protein